MLVEVETLSLILLFWYPKEKNSKGGLVLSTTAGSSGRLPTRLCDTWDFNLHVLKLSPENCPGFNVTSLVCVCVYTFCLLICLFCLFCCYFLFKLRVLFQVGWFVCYMNRL